MYRNVINELAAWYENSKRKILCVKGAPGVGKTWSVKDFATAFFDSSIYVDISKHKSFGHAISGIYPKKKNGSIDDASFIVSDEEMNDHSIESRIADFDFLLEQHFEDDIDFGSQNFDNCLFIFDELQDVANAAEFFHAYRKKHDNYTICLIASSMEISEYEYHYKDVFEIIRMRPLTFEEYLIANKAHPLIAAIQNSKSEPLKPFEEEAAATYLKEFLLTGGMPKIVHEFRKERDYSVIRPLQKQLLKQYEGVIYNNLSLAMTQRCRRIWKSIPMQLEKSNKKFMYKFAEENARAREYSEATQKLCDLGFVRKLPRLKTGELPLEENADYKSFELFLVDHGLLRAMYDLPVDATLTAEDIFAEANGAIAEQFIFQELSSKVGYLYYWISGATARVPFIYEGEDAPIPVDIRFVPNKKAQNVKIFCARNSNSEISLKISMNQVSLEKSVLNIPAYALWAV